jgi:hypothetical protein
VFPSESRRTLLLRFTAEIRKLVGPGWNKMGLVGSAFKNVSQRRGKVKIDLTPHLRGKSSTMKQRQPSLAGDQRDTFQQTKTLFMMR